MQLIGIVGNIGSGKDTAANMLVSRGFVVAALADRLKQLAHKIFLFDEETLFGPSEKRNAIDSRGSNPTYWNEVYFRAGQRVEELVSLFAYAPEHDSSITIAEFLVVLKELSEHPKTFSARRALQLMGTDWGRKIWDEVWVKALKTTVSKIHAGFEYSRLKGLSPRFDVAPKGVVITDCRFNNEAKAIKSWGGKVYWIDASKRNTDLSHEMHKHASEPSFEDFEDLDGIIDNNSSLMNLSHIMKELA